ncbi:MULTISPECIES: MaoC/PaaZ C-terminal domain-containing protein [unclassified Mycobacterium]|uniref:MaoC/PaaZ C-terminal domain-containing protein n=1 Tax=unclassified Mycobacterium TaxID=2642494 RepID=UPI0029C636E4|nr:MULTISPECIES: MaoC/PaaZ C-terminal domain-containing protein [unclassified Mycobacterium]
MKLDPNLVGLELSPQASTWTKRDCALYALGIGAGHDDPAGELDFTTDGSGGRSQRVYPTFGVLAGTAAGVGELIAALGDAVDFTQMLHGEQRLDQLATLPADAAVTAKSQISAIWDKSSATVVETTSDVADADTGEVYCRSTQSMFFRGVGGWGGERGPSTPKWSPPPADPDRVFTARTRADQALLYRLSGDHNPLHVDPEVAKAAGFDRPILHGLCVYGIAGRLLLAGYCDADPSRFKSLSGRFSATTVPGDTLTVDTWQSSPGIVDFCVKNDSGAVLFSQGRFEFSADSA